MRKGDLVIVKVHKDGTKTKMGEATPEKARDLAAWFSEGAQEGVTFEAMDPKLAPKEQRRFDRSPPNGGTVGARIDPPHTHGFSTDDDRPVSFEDNEHEYIVEPETPKDKLVESPSSSAGANWLFRQKHQI